MAQYSDFGIAVKKRLLDIGQNNAWLCEQVKEKTGLYCDSAYMSKLLTGAMKTTSMVRAIREILGLEAGYQTHVDEVALLRADDRAELARRAERGETVSIGQSAYLAEHPEAVAEITGESGDGE